ncbi:MAG TPA: hypothetical protein VFE41_20765 [Acetobacteraceae bacterium]|jgi:hypothetical protein|nr:hypothetical protein [Acetobacteraceae bacterium]
MNNAHRIRPLGHSDQGGRPDGVQVMVAKGHAYVGHMFSDGIAVIDVTDPRTPKPVNFVACPANTRASHIQVHDGLLLGVNAANVWALQQYEKQQDYFGKSLADSFDRRDRGFASGMRVFDLADPAAPREIGFMPVDGIGLHRIWWVGGRYAYASAHFDGFIDHILVVIDLADPTKPEIVGRWWFPGMNRAAGESPTWPDGQRWALHHMITAGDLGYAAWRDGGFTIMDLSDPNAPKLRAHRNWAPPFAGGTHTPLPLPGRGLVVVADEATSNRCAKGLAYTWVLDVRAPDNPVTIATMPTPTGEDFCAKGGKFGPHNLHENRPGSFQSEELIFATYHNAGVRVFDIANAHEPKEVAHFIPPPPVRIVDIRPGAELVTQSTDVFVAADGTIYVTDTNGGLSILAFDG